MSFELKKIKVNALGKSVAQQIERKIIYAEICMGEKLPSEAKLAEQTGVSRRAIRDALKILETKGLVELHKGKGAFVRRNDFNIFLQALGSNIHSYLSTARASLNHIIQFRILIEGGAVEELAKGRELTILEDLEKNIGKQRDALKRKDSEAYSTVHREYHAIIVSSLKNPVVSMIYQEVAKLIWERMKTKSKDFEIVQKSINEHSTIVKMARDGKIAEAREAMLYHLTQALVQLS